MSLASPPWLDAFGVNVMQTGQKIMGFSSGRWVDAAAALLQRAAQDVPKCSHSMTEPPYKPLKTLRSSWLKVWRELLHFGAQAQSWKGEKWSSISIIQGNAECRWGSRAWWESKGTTEKARSTDFYILVSYKLHQAQNVSLRDRSFLTSTNYLF